LNYCFCPHSGAMESSQPLTEMSTKVFVWDKVWRADSCVVLVPNVEIQRLSGKDPTILNISRTGRVALIQLRSPSEETLSLIREQSLSRGASESAVRCR
jgi:hypothetical protein